MLRGGLTFGSGHGALGDKLAFPALLLVLLDGGVLMGFEARWAGGCAMGHGLRGSAVRLPGSLLATASFMSIAVAVTWLIHLAIGGGL